VASNRPTEFAKTRSICWLRIAKSHVVLRQSVCDRLATCGSAPRPRDARALTRSIPRLLSGLRFFLLRNHFLVALLSAHCVRCHPSDPSLPNILGIISHIAWTLLGHCLRVLRCRLSPRSYLCRHGGIIAALLFMICSTPPDLPEELNRRTIRRLLVLGRLRLTRES